MDKNLSPAFSLDTLMGELGSWNRQEQRFGELFGEQALRDRDFQKMKLREYDRLWIKHGGKAMSTDEKAILVMLRYQRRRMEKALHPGLLRRVLRRLLVSVRVLNQRRLERARSREAAPFPYQAIQVPAPGQDQGQGQSASRSTDLNQAHGERRRYGPDLGRRLRGEQRKSKGPSL